jgi:hypothetical protein
MVPEVSRADTSVESDQKGLTDDPTRVQEMDCWSLASCFVPPRADIRGCELTLTDDEMLQTGQVAKNDRCELLDKGDFM